MFGSQSSALKRRRENLFILVLYFLDEAETEPFFQLSQMVSRLEVLLRESVFGNFETQTFCKTARVIDIELLRLSRSLLVLEHYPDKFIILGSENVQLMLFVVPMGRTILNNSYLGGSVLFWEYFHRCNPFELNVIDLQRSTGWASASLALVQSTLFKATDISQALLLEPWYGRASCGGVHPVKTWLGGSVCIAVVTVFSRSSLTIGTRISTPSYSTHQPPILHYLLLFVL